MGQMDSFHSLHILVIWTSESLPLTEDHFWIGLQLRLGEKDRGDDSDNNLPVEHADI